MKKKEKPKTGERKTQFKLIGGILLSMLCLLLPSCKDSFIMDHYDDDPILPDGTLTLIELPGYIGVRILPNNSSSTRAEDDLDDSDKSTQPGDYDKDKNPDSFLDGETDEYALAPGEHHYVVLYPKTTGQDPMPMSILIIDNNDTYKDPTDNNNLTLTIKRLYISSNIQGAEGLKTVTEVREWLEGADQAYVLLNFDFSTIDITNLSTATQTAINGAVGNLAKLGKVLKTEFPKLITKSYVIRTDKDGAIVTTNGTDYFTMSNSVYFSTSANKATFDNTIISSRVYELEDDARQNPAIQAHVERVASKFTIDFSGLDSSKKDNQDGYIFVYKPSSTVKVFSPGDNNGLIIDGSSYTIVSTDNTWEIGVLGYGLNALESSSYLLKSLTKSYYFDRWQDVDNSRSYWAEDLNYKVDNNTLSGYPMQFRQVLEDTENIQVNHKAGEYSSGKIDVSKTNSSHLTYYPFTHFNGKKGDPYSLENTYDDDTNALLGDRGYYSAGTHLILVAQLLIDNVNSNDLYMDQNSIVYTSDKQLISAKLNIFEKVILNQSNSGLHILETNWTNHTKGATYTELQPWYAGSYIWYKGNGSTTWRKIESNDLELIEAELAGGDGQLLIAPKYRSTGDTYCLAPIDEESNIDESLKVEITYDHLISLFHKEIGAVDHFSNRYMYYPAGIPHHVSKIGLESYKTLGDIGVVRNNWYNIQITSIEGVGRPVDNTNQPIIPNLDVKRDYVNMSVKIIDWHGTSQNIGESNLDTKPKTPDSSEEEDDSNS